MRRDARAFGAQEVAFFEDAQCQALAFPMAGAEFLASEWQAGAMHSDAPRLPRVPFFFFGWFEAELCFLGGACSNPKTGGGGVKKRRVRRVVEKKGA